jgi:hypothetical protein
MFGVARKGDKSTGHDGCSPVPWNENLSTNTFCDERAVALKDTMATAHGCKNHSSHKPTISGVSSYTFANGRGFALKTSTMSNCADKVNEVSAITFADF